MTNPVLRSGGRILVDQLVAQGVTHVFCVPGESYLPVLDALHDAPIHTVTCRHESGAGMMAEAVGKLTGRPGIACVTRGPGATNAAHAIHIAEQDSTPLILFVGLIARDMRGRGAFQEFDCAAAFGGMAKWVAEIDQPSRIPEMVSRAFHVAMQGRPGPVVLGLPEDMLSEMTHVADAARVEPADSAPSSVQMVTLAHMLADARQPVLVLGGSRWSTDAVRAIGDFAERFALPVVCSMRRQMLFDADHPCFAGELGFRPNPRILDTIKDSDLLLLVGGRLGEVPSQSYTLLDIPSPTQKLVHVHPGAEELGRVYHPALAIQASPAAFASATELLHASERPAWAERTEALHQSYLSWSDHTARIPGDLQMGEVMRFLREELPGDAVICNGAGNYASWSQRFYRFRQYGTQLAPISGSMGYGVPAAIAAKLLDPARTVVAFAGDGCFLMTGQEFATAVQQGAAIIVVVVDNGMYGSIRMQQEREYPARISATMLHNPDFAAYARAFGGHGERVHTADEFREAFRRAQESGKPALLHCLLSPEAITANKSLSEIRDEALRAQKARVTR